MQRERSASPPNGPRPKPQSARERSPEWGNTLRYSFDGQGIQTGGGQVNVENVNYC